jgi:hypothetical protein
MRRRSLQFFALNYPRGVFIKTTCRSATFHPIMIVATVFNSKYSEKKEIFHVEIIFIQVIDIAIVINNPTRKVGK